MTNLTSLIIRTRGNDIECLAAGPYPDSEKYIGWVWLNSDGEPDHPLLRTKPVYNTRGEAVEAMQEIVGGVREGKQSSDQSENIWDFFRM